MQSPSKSKQEKQKGREDMEDVKLDINFILEEYAERLKQLTHDNIVLKAENLALRQLLEQNGGDEDGKDNLD